jgi:hypothetical protein
MKIILMFLLMVIACTAHAADLNCNVFDGYCWEKTDVSAKYFFVSGYILGYSAGSSMGESVERTKGVGEEIVKIKWYKLNKKADYYVNEVDSFFKTYPLCKSKPMYETMLRTYP